MLIGGTVGYWLLRWISPGGSRGGCSGAPYVGKSKLEMLLGPNIWPQLKGKFVVDFGCGNGREAIEAAKAGALRVLGLDIREDSLAEARSAAREAGVEETCFFATHTNEKADVILSLDAFEHFSDPAAILKIMAGLLKPDGAVIASFGPTWYHPLGGHLFSVFPWAHLLFTEKALIRWRTDFKTDGATRFGEVAGGLNQMTIRRFERLIEESDFRFAHFEPVPIRVARRLHKPWTRELFTALVRCRLVKKSA